MKWFETSGGPFGLLPRPRVLCWDGVAGQDYANACRACGDDWFASFEDGLVLCEPHRTGVFTGPVGPVVVQWVSAESEGEVTEALMGLESWEWVPIPVRVGGALLLFDTALQTSDIFMERTLEIPFPAGGIVEVAEYESPFMHLYALRCRDSDRGFEEWTSRLLTANARNHPELGELLSHATEIKWLGPASRDSLLSFWRAKLRVGQRLGEPVTPIERALTWLKIDARPAFVVHVRAANEMMTALVDSRTFVVGCLLWYLRNPASQWELLDMGLE